MVRIRPVRLNLILFSVYIPHLNNLLLPLRPWLLSTQILQFSSSICELLYFEHKIYVFASILWRLRVRNLPTGARCRKWPPAVCYGRSATPQARPNGGSVVYLSWLSLPRYDLSRTKACAQDIGFVSFSWLKGACFHLLSIAVTSR